MLYKTEGIVLKSMEYEEADKIVTIYTKNYGKITAIAKGVRKTKSKFGSSLEILTHSIFLIYKGRNIDIVSQTEILESFFSTSKEVSKFAFAANCVEIVNKLTEEREININLFNLLKEVLHYLRETNDPKLLALSFKWQTMSILGYKPSLIHCCRCNKSVEGQEEMYFNTREGGLMCKNCIAEDKEECIKVSLYFNKLLRKILITRLSTISNATIPDKKVKELEKITDIYIAYHSEKSFKTDRFLKTL
ncbi:DNA repair protein RecO [Candidatus Atribacteria bacterium MT.SAG.1]|nr:DNA repair protein RecO [Candidatus Atribacteria bacterium MT.SAG.1]